MRTKLRRVLQGISTKKATRPAHRAQYEDQEMAYSNMTKEEPIPL